MKKYFLLFSVLIISLSACKKTDVATQAAVDDSKIQAYFKANNVTGTTKDASGVYYKVLIPGTGAYPTSTSNVKVSYTGKYLNGQSFDAVTSITMLVSSIPQTGLQIGIEHINTGGRILLFIPSALGYGVSGNSSSVPANAVLIYTVDLQGF